jgi:putative oligomerization/nucleic acid binding protein
MALLREKVPETTAELRSARPGLGYAYLMTGLAVGGICVSGILGCIFSPDLITTSGTSFGGTTQQHIPLAAYSGWIWFVIALAMVLPTATRGIRAKVTDRAPWAVLGFGVGGIWIVQMFISIFTPQVVTGTAPWLTWVPLAGMISVLAALVLTGLLCKMVKSAAFEPAGPPSEQETSKPTLAQERTDDGTVTKLRQLAQLRDSGVITEAEFQAKKDDLLSRI